MTICITDNDADIHIKLKVPFNQLIKLFVILCNYLINNPYFLFM